jgi:Immunoglobulin-like domain of bacterial spore germination
MRINRAVLMAAVLVASCSSNTDAGGGTAVSAPESDPTTVTSAPGTEPTTTVEQPAIWPTADVVFGEPEEAAADFVTEALGVPPKLGEFRQGDSRSGEIEVYVAGEGVVASMPPRSVLLLRQLGPDDGWFVIAAANENAAISSPESAAEVPAGPLDVEGVARGFEASVSVTAFLAGDAQAQLDQVVTQAGNLDGPLPWGVSLDLSGAAPGDVVALLVRGGAGLENDPGDFGAIPVVIAG